MPDPRLACPRCADGRPTCRDEGFTHAATCATYVWASDVCGPCASDMADEFGDEGDRRLPGMVRRQVWAWVCLRCSHWWCPRDKTREPNVCPKCKSPYWNRMRRARTSTPARDEPRETADV